MHAIKCPNCGKRVKISRAVQNAKLRCPACNNVWVGSSEIIPDEGAPPRSSSGARSGGVSSSGQEQPQSAQVPQKQVRTGYHPRPRRPKNMPVLVAIVGVGIVGITAFLVLAYHYYMHPRVITKDKKGGAVVSNRRMQRDEAKKTVKKSLEDAHRAKAMRQPAADARQETAPQQKVETHAKVYAAEARPLSASKDGGSSQIKVELAGNDVEADSIGKTWITGWAINTTENTVISANITAGIYDNSGSPMAEASSTVCKFIPPKGRVPFSLAASVGEDADVDDIKPAAESVLVSAEVACLQIDSIFVDVDRTSPRRIILTGDVDYTLKHNVTNARIYGDFFTSGGVHVGSAWGELKDSRGNKTTTAGPSQDLTFEISFMPTGSYVADVVRQWSVRLVGRKSD